MDTPYIFIIHWNNLVWQNWKRKKISQVKWKYHFKHDLSFYCKLFLSFFTEGILIPLSVPSSLIKTIILQNLIQHILLSSTIKAKGTTTGWLCKLNNASLNSAASWNCISWILVFVELTSKVIFLVFLWQPGVRRRRRLGSQSRVLPYSQYQYQTLSFAEKIDSNGSLQDKTATKELVVHA